MLKRQSIRRIRKIDPSERHDLSIPINNNFFANGILVHNSLIRAEWTEKSGFYKFGTRTHLLDRSDPTFGEACDLIVDGFSCGLERFFYKRNIERAVFFFEFFGEHSFAGSHVEEPHQVKLIDVDTYKKGLIEPELFDLLSDEVPCAQTLFSIKVCREEDLQEILRQIEDSTLEGMTFEGVVFKSGSGHKRISFKHKSRAWLNKLAEVCGENKARFEELR